MRKRFGLDGPRSICSLSSDVPHASPSQGEVDAGAPPQLSDPLCQDLPVPGSHWYHGGLCSLNFNITTIK
jgi:hypothetical protein